MVMFVGWGGNNGLTFTGGVIADQEWVLFLFFILIYFDCWFFCLLIFEIWVMDFLMGIFEATKDKVPQAIYFGSITQYEQSELGLTMERRFMLHLRAF